MYYSSEIVATPATPLKKRIKITPPSPGTSELDLLPAVSLSYAFISLVAYFVLGSSVYFLAQCSKGVQSSCCPYLFFSTL